MNDSRLEGVSKACTRQDGDLVDDGVAGPWQRQGICSE